MSPKAIENFLDVLQEEYLREIVAFTPRDFERLWFLYHKDDQRLGCLKKYIVELICYRQETFVRHGMTLAKFRKGEEIMIWQKTIVNCP
jgi:hypothetical protein